MYCPVPKELDSERAGIRPFHLDLVFADEVDIVPVSDAVDGVCRSFPITQVDVCLGAHDPAPYLSKGAEEKGLRPYHLRCLHTPPHAAPGRQNGLGGWGVKYKTRAQPVPRPQVCCEGKAPHGPLGVLGAF